LNKPKKMKTLKKITLAIFLLGNVMNLQAQELKSFEENGKWGFKDDNDKVVIPAKYHEIGYFSEDFLFKVKLNDKWGLIDKSEKEVVPFIYDELSESINSIDNKLITASKKDGLWSFIQLHTGDLWIDQFFEDVKSKVFGSF
jgi:hypothetical protein